MKKITQLLALAALTLFSSCEEDKKEDTGMKMGNLHISKSKPQPGEEIQVRYKNQGTEIPEATVNYLIGRKYYQTDINLKDSANALYGNIQIPDTVQAMAFNFKTGENFENNNNSGYVFTLYNKEGKELNRSKATKAIYLSNSAMSFDVKAEKDSILAIFDEAIKENPEIEEYFDVDYTNAKMAVDRETGEKYIEKRLDYYHSKDSLNYENYVALSELYSLKNDDIKNDSITSIAAKKFPKSDLARTETMYQIVEAKSLDEKLELYNEYINLVGKKPSYQHDIMLRFIANEYVENNDWDQVEKYASQINDPRELARFYNSIAWEKAKNGEDLETAARLSKNSIDVLSNVKGNYSAKPEFYSKSQYDNALEWGISNYSDTYALIQFQQGDLEAAIKTQEQALTDKSGADMTTRYVQYLIEAEQYKKAQNKAEDFIANNRANAEMTDYLKTAYAENENSDDFENYLSKLEVKATNKAREDLRKNMLSEKAEDFELTDLEGNMVKLSDLKGKTVILDFWATWCGPCKQSFPGMQRAVEKYADNDNVEFLFVNTWENGDDREKMVSDYIEGENYDFHVIMDQPVLEGSREFITTSNFGINGIPTKIIVGPEGNVNFKKVGYSGNNEKMLKEIGLMIELTQKNKQPEA